MPSSKSSVDKRDVYYRKGKSDGYRARSAYKLLHLDEEFDLFRGVGTAVDLCAAPGSWSQVLSNRLRPGIDASANRVVSIDLQPMAPLPGITTLQTDITLPETVPRVLDALGGRKADLVICDGAPDVTGVHDLDAYLHSQLLLAALTLSLTLLAPHATLIFKIFLSPIDPTASLLRSQLRVFFPGPGDELPPGSDPKAFAEFDADVQPESEATTEVPSQATASGWSHGLDSFGRRGGVWIRKPRSSRKGSGEAFVVCRNFDPSTLPLPAQFSSESLAALRRQVGGTLTLESLSSLGSGSANPKFDGSWPASKGFVGGGDLNGGSLHVPEAERRALSVQTEIPHRRDYSLGSIEDAPSPVEATTNLFPASTSFMTPVVRTPAEGSRFRAGLDTPCTPQPLPSPVPGVLSSGGPREFREPPVSSHSGGLFGPSTFGSPPSLAAGHLPTHSSLNLPLFPAPGSPNLTANERDIFASTPHAEGAVSPALSSSSKTDAFFSASQKSTLPVPPPPLSSSPSSLGRVPSIGRGVPPLARARIVTTPTAPITDDPQLSPPPIAPTPLRAVTGPAPVIVSESPAQAPTPAKVSLSPYSTPGRSLPPNHLVRELHLGDPADAAVKAGDVLTPVLDDGTLPIRSAESPGTWRLVDPLGQGAFASVWSAEPVEGGAVAAIKMVDRNSCTRNARSAIAFYREVEVLRHLVHPGIVEYIAHFSTEAYHCLVLERLGGGELFNLVEQDANRRRMLCAGPDNADGYGLVRRIFGELCRAVSWLHEVEVVHRDIKLENVIFTTNPFTLPPTSTGSIPIDALPIPLVKLTDFGLSRFILSDSPLLTTRCGSEAYAAPEVVMGSLYDGRRTDAWALGVMLYALIAGELPFEDTAPLPPGARPRASSSASTTGDSERDARRRTMHRIAKGEYGWREGVGSSSVRTLVASLLTRDPSRRARVAELWDEPWMAEGPGAVPRPQEPMKAKPSGTASINDGSVDDCTRAPPDFPRRASDTPHVVIQQGVLVDHERIDDVARLDMTAA